MEAGFTREEAIILLLQYNQEPFHIQHALTVEGVMRYAASEKGFEEDAKFWGMVGLLHDIDFEQYPEQHCLKADEILREAHASDELIHAVCSHGYGICCDIEPMHYMEKILFATDELSGLIGAAALMRPSRSCRDMEISSIKKKFKDKKFAAGCSREIIKTGAARLEMELDDLFSLTLEGMKKCEFAVEKDTKLFHYSIQNTKVQKGGILFSGSSLMENFPVSKLLEEKGYSATTYNRGIGGYVACELLQNLDVLVLQLEPSAIFINIGTNDLSNPDRTIGDLITEYDEIVTRIQDKLPEVRLYMMAYYPVNPDAAPDYMKKGLEIRNNQKILEANAQVEQLAVRHHAHYINVNHNITDAEGRLKEEYTMEGMHLNEEGYRAVLIELLPYIEAASE